MGKIPNISEVLRESSSETSRQLLGLLLSGLHPIGARSLSRSTGLTERQIGYAINNELKQLCSDLGFTLERVPRHGTYIHGSQHKKQSVLNALSRIQDKRDTLSPQDRRWSMLLQLAFEKTDWTLKTLSVWYVKSPVTIAKDIQLVRNMLKPSCNISWRRKSGYILTGDEGVIREITLRALFGLFHKKSLFAISGKKIAPVLDDALFSELVMPPQDVRFIRDVVYFATGNKSTLRSDRLLRLLFQIVISILRLRNNHKLLDSRDLKLKGQSGCWIKASKFASELEMRFQISLPPSEIFYLEKNLEALIAHEQRTVATLNFSEERIEEMVSMFSKYIHPHLQVDEQLRSDLAFYLSQHPGETFFAKPTWQTFNRRVRLHYPYVHKIVLRVLNLIYFGKELEGIKDHSSNLTLLVQAAIERMAAQISSLKTIGVYTTGPSPEETLLLSRIAVEFPGIDVIELTDAETVPQKRPAIHPKLVLSITPIDRFDLNVLVVSPFLEPEEVAKVRDYLLLSENEDVLKEDDLHSLPSLSQVLDERRILLDVDVADWRTAIRRAGKVLINHNAVTAHYIEAIIDGIEMSGPYMVVWPGIALLHAKPSDGARALDLAVVRLKKPVVFGHPKHDPVRICVVLSTVNKVSHFRILYELSQIFIDELGLDTLINSVSKNAILNYLLAKCLALQQQNFSN